MADPRRRPPPPPPPPEPEVEPDTTTMGLDGANEKETASLANGQKPGEDEQDAGFKLKFCTVCASNNNR